MPTARRDGRAAGSAITEPTRLTSRRGSIPACARLGTGLLAGFLLLCGFAAPLAASGPGASTATVRNVFIVGDSTASEYGPERSPRQGWGQALQGFLDPAHWAVQNHARSGRSARSFIEEGWLEPVERGLKAGDVLLIQFGHNDAKLEDPSRYNEPAAAFPRWLSRYITLARARAATPVLVTPLARRKFDHGQLLDTHGLYAQSVRQLAGHESVALVDLNAASMEWLRALGDEASRHYFMHVPDQQQADDTHLQQRGAVAVACMVVAGWKRVDPALVASVVRDTDCGAGVAAAQALADQAHPSAVVHEDELAREQPGPHGGAGVTTAYPFFAGAGGLAFEFRKRVLHPGAGIGLHLHHKDEVYYVVSGRGLYTLDGRVYPVGAGHAMLTRVGSTHAIQQEGREDLVLLVAFPRPPAAP